MGQLSDRAVTPLQEPLRLLAAGRFSLHPGRSADSTSCASWMRAISAPFGAASIVEQIPLPAGAFPARDPGFEDIGISSDSQLAILTGGSTNSSGHQLPAAFVQAPFTAAGATVSAVTVGSGAQLGRGAGSVRFRPAAQVTAVPTLSFWGLVALLAGLAAGGWQRLRSGVPTRALSRPRVRLDER